MPTDDQHEAILAAAAGAFEQLGIARAGRRDVALAAGVPKRDVNAIARNRTELLAEVVERLPFPPVPQRMREQAADSDASPMQVLLEVARDALGQPQSTWDPRELQALAVAPYSARLSEVMRERMSLRWQAASAVLSQLRSGGAIDTLVDDDAAALHVIALGIGLSMLAPVAPERVEQTQWVALAARLLESLASIDPPPLGPEVETRRWRVRATLPDTPAAVSRLMRVLALVHAAAPVVIASEHAAGEQVLDMMLVVPGMVDQPALETALSAAATGVAVAPGSPDDGEDIAARVLDAAAALALRPAFAPVVVAELLGADSWEATAAAAGEDASAHVMRLQWTPDLHVVVRRSAASFTRTEERRASALLRLVSAQARARGDDDPARWAASTRDGGEVVMRLARPEDTEAVRDMHERCSEHSRFQRYFQPMSEWRQANLRRISGGHRGATIVVTDAPGHVIGLGNVFPDSPDASGRAEIALIVEDAHQGRGIGAVLLERLLELAERMGFDGAVAYVLSSNARMLDMLERTGLAWAREPDPDLGPGTQRMVAGLGG